MLLHIEKFNTYYTFTATIPSMQRQRTKAHGTRFRRYVTEHCRALWQTSIHQQPHMVNWQPQLYEHQDSQHTSQSMPH